MKPRQNELFRDPENFISIDPNELKSPLTHYSDVRDRRAELRRLVRKESAALAISGFRNGMEIYGFTKGQFSLIQLIQAAIDITGPCNMAISTWTMAAGDVKAISESIDEGKVSDVRFLIDLSFQRREPGMAHSLRQQFGFDSIRVTSIHSKFILLTNEKWKVVIRTSMNLNMNPRIEDFTMSDDPAISDFLEAIIDEIFQTQEPRGLDASHSEREKSWGALWG